MNEHPHAPSTPDSQIAEQRKESFPKNIWQVFERCGIRSVDLTMKLNNDFKVLLFRTTPSVDEELLPLFFNKLREGIVKNSQSVVQMQNVSVAEAVRCTRDATKEGLRLLIHPLKAIKNRAQGTPFLNQTLRDPEDIGLEKMFRQFLSDYAPKSTLLPPMPDALQTPGTNVRMGSHILSIASPINYGTGIELQYENLESYSIDGVVKGWRQEDDGTYVLTVEFYGKGTFTREERMNVVILIDHRIRPSTSHPKA